MSSNGHNRPPNDPKVVGEIVNKLKKQGLFDKFRRDCLSDVDTKPAYLNLSRRVDTLCSNFLSNITWAPDLNKNKLRESLRNEITQGKMLSTGVGLIVSQVVNPKIKTFKPEIDAVVCEFFGIDPAEWAEKLRSREQQRSDRFKQLAHDETPNNAQIGNAAHMAGANPQVFSGSGSFGVQGMAGVGYMMSQMQQQPNIPGMAGLSSSMAQSIQNTLGAQMPATMFPNMPPTIPNFNLPPPGYNPQMPYDPSVPPPHMAQTAGAQNFSALQQQNFAQIPGMANMSYQNQVMMQGMSGADLAAFAVQQAAMGTTMTSTTMTPLDTANTASTDLKDSKSLDKKEKEKKKELASLTVEDLLNVALPNKPSRDKRREGKKMDSYGKDRDRDRRREAAGSPIVSHGRRDLPGKPDRKDSDRRSDRMDERRLDRDDKMDRHIDEKRGERLDDRRSEHSDFSERSHISDNMTRMERDREREKMRGRDRDGDRGYRDRDGGRPSPGRSGGSLRHSEPPMIKPPSPPPEPPPKSEGKVYHFAWDDMDSDASDSDVALSSVHTSDLSSFDDGLSDGSGLEDISSDDLKSEEEGITKPPEPPEPPAEEPKDAPDIKQKPRKLVALQYNYSDSEEEETREERKERIASEKEERYLKRQLRRAELEARKEEKLVSARKKAAEKEKAESQGIVQPPEPAPEPERKQRRVRANRTKEALKEQLLAEKREQKAQQMVIDRRMAVRRQRKRNSKYMSDDFTSIFTDKRKILSNEGYGESGQKSDTDYSPGRPVSPSTPTQDEMDYSTSDADVIITAQETIKPVYDGPAALGLRSRRMDDHHPGGRPTTPFSDMSDKGESDMGRGRRRRRTLSGRHSPDLEEKKPVRQQEADRAHSQRYDDSDLYKPHTSYRTRRRGTSPIDKDAVPPRGAGPAGSPPRGGFSGRRPGAWTPNTPPVASRGVRPPSPPSEDEHRPPGWQRHGSQEGFKRGRPQHFPGSPERPGKVPMSPEGRPPGLYPPRASPVTKPAADPGSAGEEGAEKRVRLPLSMISFGEAAKQSRQPPKPAIPINTRAPPTTREKRAPPPPKNREPDLFAEFGEAARRTEAARRAGDLSLTTTTIKERMSLTANAISPVTTGKQRISRREGETIRFPRKGFPPGTSKAAMGGLPRPLGSIQPPLPDGEMHAPERDREAGARQYREHRPDRDYKKRWSRQSSQDEDDWPSIPKPKSLEQEREEWEPISDDEDLGDNYMETAGEGRLGKRVAKKRKRPRSQDVSPERQWDSQSQDSIHDVSEEILRDMYDSPDDEAPQDRPQGDDRYQDSYRQEPHDRLTDRPQDGQPPLPPVPPARRTRDRSTELEEGEEEDSSDYEQRDSYPTKPPEPYEARDPYPTKPPEPPEEPPAPRKPQRSASVSSGELKDDEDDLPTELPKAGMSPTAKRMTMTEMPRPGLSPSCSPSRSMPRSPMRSIPRSPTRSMPRSPTRSMPRSPTRSIPRSPTRSIPRSPTRSTGRSPTRSPTRSIPRSPTRSMTRSPPRSIPRSPSRSMPRSPTRSMPRSPSRSVPRSPDRSGSRSPVRPRSPTRSIPRSPSRSIPQSPTRSIPFGGPSTPPDPSDGRPRSPMGEPVSSPESGEVGDDDYSSEKDGPLQSDADRPPSPPLRHGMRDMDRPPSPPSPSGYSGRGHRDGDGGHYSDGDHMGVPSGRGSPPIPNTRSTRRRTEEEALPIAKRLRRV